MSRLWLKDLMPMRNISESDLNVRVGAKANRR